MISESSPLFRIADLIADAINPLLALSLLALLFIATRKREIDWRFWLAALLGVALVYVLRTVDKRADLWERIGGDYSTHSALAAALIVPLILLRHRLWPILAGVLALYALLMIALGFHTLLDILTTLIVIVPLVFLVHRVLVRRATKQSTPADVA